MRVVNQLRSTGIPLVYVLIAVSTVVSFVSNFGDNHQILYPLLISEYKTGLTEVFSGQIWRLITPIFLHLSIYHLAFNMLWLWDLGGAVERLQGGRTFLILVLVSGVLSNLGQHAATGPLFGGMSGVVYTLLGYVWMQGLYNPRFYASLRKPIVIMMLVWFALCWTGLLGPIANITHTVGLAFGIVWGYLYAKFIASSGRSSFL